MTNQLAFQNTSFNVIEREKQIWLMASDVAQALGYADTRSVTKIYSRHADEFTPCMTLVVSLTTKGYGNGTSEKGTRIFSLRGAHLIAMFARTDVAKAFRKWVLDVLDREINQSQSDLNLGAITELPPHTRSLLLQVDELGSHLKPIDIKNKALVDIEIVRAIQRDAFIMANALAELKQRMMALSGEYDHQKLQTPIL
ncbi:hypothetical protein B4P00_20190 [Shewanella xiamenensis]|uniref:BRO-N domain-containing protein n=1 Tax=Shewanella xiamenensis TaxID=332186 RepID=UPI001C4E19A2|nr:BRO family protein [Shewanella xiamenensis]MBW0298510.1 hypothetical protein [Shewanella xiamenensis]